MLCGLQSSTSLSSLLFIPGSLGSTFIKPTLVHPLASNSLSNCVIVAEYIMHGFGGLFVYKLLASFLQTFKRRFVFKGIRSMGFNIGVFKGFSSLRF